MHELLENLMNNNIIYMFILLFFTFKTYMIKRIKIIFQLKQLVNIVKEFNYPTQLII